MAMAMAMPSTGVGILLWLLLSLWSLEMTIKGYGGYAALIPLAIALDARSEQNYELKLDQDLKNILHEAEEKKVSSVWIPASTPHFRKFMQTYFLNQARYVSMC
jgi:hypothetical protein